MRLDVYQSSLRASRDCADVLTASGGFPALWFCEFSESSAILHLATNLLPGVEYSLTLMIILPQIRLPDVSGMF